MSIGSLEFDATTVPPMNRASGTGDVKDNDAMGGSGLGKGASGRSGTCSGDEKMPEVLTLAGTLPDACSNKGRCCKSGSHTASISEAALEILGFVMLLETITPMLPDGKRR